MSCQKWNKWINTAMGAIKCVELKPFHCVYKQLKWLTEATIYISYNHNQCFTLSLTRTRTHKLPFCFRHYNRSIGIRYACFGSKRPFSLCMPASRQIFETHIQNSFSSLRIKRNAIKLKLPSNWKMSEYMLNTMKMSFPKWQRVVKLDWCRL